MKYDTMTRGIPWQRASVGGLLEMIDKVAFNGEQHGLGSSNSMNSLKNRLFTCCNLGLVENDSDGFKCAAKYR
jgi:hypothetical protein